MRKTSSPALALLAGVGLVGALLSSCGDGVGIIPPPNQGYPNAGGQYPNASGQHPSASGQYPGSRDDYPGSGGSLPFDSAAAAKKICDRLIACGTPAAYAEICLKMMAKEVGRFKNIPHASEILDCVLAEPCEALKGEEGPEEASKRCAKKYGVKIDDKIPKPVDNSRPDMFVSRPRPDLFMPTTSPDAG